MLYIFHKKCKAHTPDVITTAAEKMLLFRELNDIASHLHFYSIATFGMQSTKTPDLFQCLIHRVMVFENKFHTAETETCILCCY